MPSMSATTGFGFGHYGSDVNSASNATGLEVGNGAFNSVGGSIAVLNEQQVGNSGFGFGHCGSDTNLASNTTDIVAGNGVGNHIGGNLTVENVQDVGNHSLFPIII